MAQNYIFTKVCQKGNVKEKRELLVGKGPTPSGGDTVLEQGYTEVDANLCSKIDRHGLDLDTPQPVGIRKLSQSKNRVRKHLKMTTESHNMASNLVLLYIANYFLERQMVGTEEICVICDCYQHIGVAVHRDYRDHSPLHCRPYQGRQQCQLLW
jgi:hypothetical protein